MYVRGSQFLHDASEVRMQVIDPGQQAENTRMSGLPPGTLTLELPAVEPLVRMPVIELFLSR